MKSQELAGAYLLVFKKGEPLVARLAKFCQGHGITGGFFWGIGAVLSAELGFYDLESQTYNFQKFDELHEIVSLSGNVAMADGESTVHAHAVLANKDLQTRGGHLKEAIVGGTCEMLLRVPGAELTRKHDDETGLKLLNL